MVGLGERQYFGYTIGKGQGDTSGDKRTVPTLILIMMLVIMLPLQVKAEDKTVVLENGFSWTLDGKGVLTITGSGEMPGLGLELYSLHSEIKSIVIKEGITTVRGYGFEYCENLESVSLPDTITEIGNSAFEHCPKLKKINFPASLTRIGGYAFCECSSLQNVKFKYGLKRIEVSSFSGCDLITSVFIPSSVSLIGNHAFGSDSLKMIQVSEKNGYYCSIDGVLYNKSMTKLCFYPSAAERESFTIPESITEIKYHALSGAKYLKILYISKQVNFIDKYAFYACNALSMVYYEGSVNDWSQINIIKRGNTSLINAKIICAEAALEAPAIKGETNPKTGRPILTWNSVEGAASYKIYRSKSENKGYKLRATTTKTSWRSTAGNVGETYFYRVSAVDAEGNESVKGNVFAHTVKYATPVLKTENVASTGYIKLTWNTVPDAGYVIYRSSKKDGTFTEVASRSKNCYIVDINHGSYPGKTLYYYVVASGMGNRDIWSLPSNIVESMAKLPRPTVALKAERGKITLSWDHIYAADGYRIYRSTSEDGAYELIHTMETLDMKISYVDEDLVVGQRYYYKVEAYMENCPAATSTCSRLHYRTAR